MTDGGMEVKTINECYEVLGQTVFRSIDDSWIRAVLNIRKLERSATFNGEYWNVAGLQKNIEVNIDLTTVKAVKRIHEIITAKNNSKWNRAKFHVTSEGKFEMEFIWDQELQNEVDRLNKL